MRTQFLHKVNQVPGRAAVLHCGDGAIALPFLEEGWEVTAYDEDPGDVRRALEKGLRAECLRLETVRGSYDAVLCPYILGRLGFDAAVLAHLASLVSAGGHLLTTVPTRKSRGVRAVWAQGGVPRRFKTHRFDLLDRLDLDPSTWFHRLFSRQSGEILLIARRMENE